eukprot:12409883-Karenia_brevis.AAC.1
MNLLALLGKKSGGSRTVAIMASFYRLLMRVLQHEIVVWDEKKAGFWDTALRGSSALRAQLARALEVELANEEGLWVLHLLWDMRKFFDSVRVSVLVSRLRQLDFPMHAFFLGAVAHKAPRILQVGPTLSDVISGTGRSIVAGCVQSVSWIRGLMYNLVEKLGQVMPGQICYEHVDDLSHALSSRSKMSLHNAVVKIGAIMKQ